MGKPIYELRQSGGSSVWADVTTRSEFQDFAVTFVVDGRSHRLEAYHTQEPWIFAAALGVCVLQESAVCSEQLRQSKAVLDEGEVCRREVTSDRSPDPLEAWVGQWWSLDLGVEEPEWSLRAGRDGIAFTRVGECPLTVVWRGDQMGQLLAGMIWRTCRVAGRPALSRTPTHVYLDAVVGNARI